jgi:hypothetical protein
VHGVTSLVQNQNQLLEIVHGVTSFGSAVSAAAIPEAKCCLLIDTWYPGITQKAKATLADRIHCPAFALGSAAFNARKEGSTTLYCEGSVDGMQSEVLAAFGDCVGQAGALLVVPSESRHTMVDDMGAIFMDKYDFEDLTKVVTCCSIIILI